ncbi:MAG: hypothetical protein ACLQB4_04265 [Beijerinckiaceae bacterium]
MARVMYLRIASVLGLFALAFLIVGLDPFLGADPTAGASFTNRTPAVVVNRSRKGDRLSIAPDWQGEFGSQPLTRPSAAPRAQIPVGCDPAFSPITSPAANVYRRCLT